MIGETVSHYCIEDKLGGGGMGVVYRARDLKLDRDVALEFLPSELSNDAERKERFILEAKAASALDHPNIGTIFEVDETSDGRLFIAMAYYQGETLKKKIAEERTARWTRGGHSYASDEDWAAMFAWLRESLSPRARE